MDSTREQAIPASLPGRVATLYALGSFSGNLISRVAAVWVFYFYAHSGADGGSRMPLGLLGGIITATGLISAFDDMLIGYWSDRTRGRWGRRIPYIVLGTPIWALLIFLLWAPPVPGASLANAVYLYLVLQSFEFFRTLSGGPFEALLPEIATRNDDRVRIVVRQVLFGTIGAAVALVAAGPVIDYLGY